VGEGEKGREGKSPVWVVPEQADRLLDGVVLDGTGSKVIESSHAAHD
jgi:hypothetical protein